MFRATSRASHTVLGFIPELSYILLRDNSTSKLELWTRSRGTALQAIILDGHELEFVREVTKACRVVDNEFNQRHAPDDIGRIYVDSFPNHAYVKEF